MRGKPAYVPYFRLAPEELIALIKGAGGIPVIGNPKAVGDDAVIQRIIAQGVMGLEVFYPGYETADIQHYLMMAQKHGLLISGGSDYRGFPGRQPEKLGAFTIEDIYAENFYRPPRI